ncbi:LPS export ABC transporter periplasmic protein LptC [Sphingomonas mucosissima]|uniref:Lipopolysaccharide-assembly, LptC-related n=1 Tax=Sphingomonas mucosissima TaxID=370959 RepID=A0A245ZPV4_9SPHN|nr:LPS export ABC transporter periplasmic protein LptC [Sphingomonas mucosissima]OWK31772.1 lipopolysaccharide-assembly, LptC-related [Sphingomonas mucosissima]
MSDIAIRDRTRRQRWAAPGSRHDKIIRTMYWLLPVLIGVLAAFLVMAPLTTAGDVSFVLDKNKVEVAKERLKIQRAQYRGSDAKGQPFALNAGSAVQRSSAEPVVEINRLAAQIRLEDGPATLTAPTGRYDMESERVKVDGPIAFRGPNNYTLDTQDATVDLKTRTLASRDGVTGTVSQGNFSADRLDADLEARTVTLRGNARLRVNPRGAR